MRLDLVIRIAVSIGSLLSCSIPATAMQGPLPNAPGQWRFASVESGQPESGTTSAELSAFLKNLEIVAQPFRWASALNPVRGVEVVPEFRVVAPPSAAGARPRPLTGEFRLTLYPYSLDCARCPVRLSSAHARLDAWANLPEAAFATDDPPPLDADEAGPMYLAPRRIGEFAGFPEYKSAPGNTSIVIVTGIARPLWLPVSNERFLRNRLRKAKEQQAGMQEAVGGGSAYQQWMAGKAERKRQRDEMYAQLIKQMPAEAAQLRKQQQETELAEEQVTEQLKAGEAADLAMRKEMTGGVQGLVDSLEAQLAALSPAQRAAPAYFGPYGLPLAPTANEKTEGAIAIVAPNPDFFDPSLPKSTVQLVIVERRPTRDAAFAKFLNAKIAQVQASLNWAQLARSVKPRASKK